MPILKQHISKRGFPNSWALISLFSLCCQTPVRQNLLTILNYNMRLVYHEQKHIFWDIFFSGRSQSSLTCANIRFCRIWLLFTIEFPATLLIAEFSGIDFGSHSHHSLQKLTFVHTSRVDIWTRVWHKVASADLWRLLRKRKRQPAIGAVSPTCW